MMHSVFSKATNKARRDGVFSMIGSIPRFSSEVLIWRIKNTFVSDAYKMIWADPNDINHRLLKSQDTDYNYDEEIPVDMRFLYDLGIAGFNIKRNIGRVVGGDWDTHTKTFDQCPIHESLKQHFAEGRSWEDTPLYQWAMKFIELSGEFYGCCSEKELKEDRLSYIDWLYCQMANYGYLTQEGAPNDERPHGLLHEISINVGRNGELIFNNRSGYHRLPLAKILGIRRVPVIVVVRHEDWQAVRREVKKCKSFSALSKRTRDLLPHPDLDTIILGHSKRWRTH